MNNFVGEERSPSNLGMAYDYSSLTKELFDTTDLISRLEFNLRGFVFEGGSFVKKRKPYLNEQGIGIVMTLVSSLVNKDTSMTYLEEKQIMYMLSNFHLELAENLGYNMLEYEIDEVDYSTVISVVMGMLEIALNKSKEGKLIELLKLTNRDIHTYTTKESSGSNNGLFSFFPFGKKKEYNNGG